MTKRHSLSIRTYIMLLIAVMTIVPLGLIVFSVLNQRNHELQSARQLAEGLSSEVGNQQKVLLAGAEQLLSCLAYVPCVQNRDAKATSALLAKLTKKNPGVTDILVADTSGLVWASALPTRGTIMTNDRRYFENVLATGNFSSGEFSLGRSLRKPAIAFAYPIKDASGKIRHVAIMGFALTKYDQLLKIKKITEFSSLVLADHQGTILFDPHRPDFIGRQDKAELFKRMVEGPDKGVFEAVGQTGQSRIFSYEKVFISGEKMPYMYVRAGIRQEDAAKKTRDDLMLNVGVMISVTILAIGFAVYFSKRGIVDKITALRGATQRIARGDLDIHVSDHVCGGELGELGSAFDAMARRLAEDIVKSKLAEEDRQENLLFIKSLLENAPVGIRVFDGESGACLLANQATADIAGGALEVMQGQNSRELASWQTSGLLEVAEAVLADGRARAIEADMLTSFGKQVSVAYIVSRFFVKENPHLLVIGRDITVEKQLVVKNRQIEAQMLHVQKLESLGVLAGGIAHDFNNILMAILGNAELAVLGLSPESPAQLNLQNIVVAAQRAADLARQMLAYSGKGRFVIGRLEINDLVTEMNNILEISISKKAAMRLNLAENLPLFEGDATQLRQIIMNLVMNASESIGERSGAITITTGSMDCDQAYLSKIWPYDKLEQGVYIYFEVADTGCGMGRDTLEKIFDPFFTTKFTGRGLGMAAVHGIVRGHHGAITVYSELGKGTSFKVFLPASPDVLSIAPRVTAPLKGATGSGTILLVDDEKPILTLGKEMLETMGYRVLTAEDGVAALEVYKDHREEIVCVILDFTMPLLDGEETFRELQGIDRQVQVVISSGFNEHEVARKFAGMGLAGFIQKPYTIAELNHRLRKVAGDRRRSQRG